MREVSDLKNMNQATTAVSTANEWVIKSWSSDIRTSLIIR